jgi:hypothetical protein
VRMKRLFLVLFAIWFAVALLGHFVFGRSAATDLLLAPSRTVPVAVPVPTGAVRADLTLSVNMGDIDYQPLTLVRDGVLTWMTKRRQVTAGQVIARVNDRPIVAFAGSAPLVDNIHSSSSPAEVQRAKQFLSGLGYLSDSDIDGSADVNFRSAVERFNADKGFGSNGPVLRASDLVWIGTRPRTRFAPSIYVGDRVSPGSQLASGGIRQVRATITESGRISFLNSGVTLVGRYRAVEFQYVQGSRSLDRRTLRALAEHGGREVTVAVGLRKPASVATVPTTAVFEGRGQETCVLTLDAVDDPIHRARPMEVTVLAEEPGLAYLRPPVPKAVVANPALRLQEEQLTCGG